MNTYYVVMIRTGEYGWQEHGRYRIQWVAEQIAAGLNAETNVFELRIVQ